MALPNLSGSNIQDTFQRVLHTDGASIFDGTGSVVLSNTEMISLQAIGTINISSAEWAQISKIGSADISPTEWGYVAQMQNVSTVSTPTFLAVRASTQEGPGFGNTSGRCGMGFAAQEDVNSDINFVYNTTNIEQKFKSNGDISGSGELVGLAVKGGTF